MAGFPWSETSASNYVNKQFPVSNPNNQSAVRMFYSRGAQWLLLCRRSPSGLKPLFISLMNVLCELSFCISHSRGHLSCLSAKAHQKPKLHPVALNYYSKFSNWWVGLNCNYIFSVRPSYLIQRVSQPVCSFSQYQVPRLSYFPLHFGPNSLLPRCTNVQTVSSLLLNPYGIKVKGILSSNLLNNVLLPSFSAAAPIPPSSMIQPPNRNAWLFSSSAALSFLDNDDYELNASVSAGVPQLKKKLMTQWKWLRWWDN